jgi:hypothetical protein
MVKIRVQGLGFRVRVDFLPGEGEERHAPFGLG